MKLHLKNLAATLALLLAACGQTTVAATDGDAANAPGTDAQQTDAAADVAVQNDTQSASAPNYFVLAEDDLLAAATAHAQFRQAQGYRTVVVPVSELVPGQVKAPALQTALAARLTAARAALPVDQPLFLLLYGDAPADSEDHVGKIPAHACQNDTEPGAGCYTDNAYADLDGDHLPDLFAGRIPVRTAAEGAAFLAKQSAFETSYEPGQWNRRISLYTGQANFSPQIDALLEQLVMTALTMLSDDFDIIGVYDNPKSPWYYTPFDAKVVDLIDQGNLAIIYIGHGSATWTEGLTADAIAQLNCAHRQPFAFFFACTAGNYVGPTPSIAETIVANKTAAIAALAAADTSHPYSNAVLAYETQRAILDGRRPTIGEAVAQAKHAMVEHNDSFRDTIDAGAGMQNIDATQRALLNRQHADLYNLIGDPATPMRYPATEVTFDAPPQGAMAKGNLTVSGKVPGIATGTALVTLECERDAILETLAPVDPTAVDAATVQANWAKASNKVAVSLEVPVAAGAFAASLSWQKKLPGGTWYIKVYAKGGGTDSFGSVLVP